MHASTVQWTSASTIRLLAIGCVMTFITNFPPAFMNTFTNTAVEQIEDYYNASFTERGHPLTFTETSLLKSVTNSGWYAAQVISSFVTPFICDHFGRKFAFVASVIGMTTAMSLQAFGVTTVYPEIFLLGRMVTALFSPINDTALVLYLQEIAPTNLRGTLSSLYMVGYSMMCLTGMTLGHEDVLGYDLRRLFLLPVIPGVIAALFAMCIPETPKFLMATRKDKDGAMRSLRFFQGLPEGQEEEMEHIQAENEDNESETSGIMVVLRTRRLRKALTLATLAVSLTFPFFAMLQSSTHFFTALGVEASTAQTSSSALMLILTLACVTSTIIVERLPRRALMLYAGALSLLSMTAFVVAFYLKLAYVGMIAVFVLVFVYGVGLAPIVWTMGPELVPTNHRSAVFALTFALFNVFFVIVNFATLTVFDLFGAVAFAAFLIVPNSLACVVLYVHLPETRAKETVQIYAELKYGPNKVRPDGGRKESRMEAGSTEIGHI